MTHNINNYILDVVRGDKIIYYSFDSISKIKGIFLV